MSLTELSKEKEINHSKKKKKNDIIINITVLVQVVV